MQYFFKLPKVKIVLIAVLIIFVFNFDEAFGSNIESAAKGNAPVKSAIIPVINIPKEIVIRQWGASHLQPMNVFNESAVHDGQKLIRAFAGSNEHLYGGIWVIAPIRGRNWGRTPKIVERQIPFDYMGHASANIIQSTCNFGFFTDDRRIMQDNGMDSNLRWMRSNKFCVSEFSTPFSSIGAFFRGDPQENIADKEEPGENHYPESIFDYRIILDRPYLTFAIWFMVVLGGGIAAIGVYVIDWGHRAGGYIMIIIGTYIAFCAGLGIEFPWVHLPFSNWWRWLL